MNAILSQKDVFACLPTGGGKSLTFQIPTLLMPGITIIIMPLIALITDQIEILNSFDIKAKMIDSHVDGSIKKLCLEIIQDKTIKFLFLTPERLIKSFNIRTLIAELEASNRINLFVIDEAHCISI